MQSDIEIAQSAMLKPIAEICEQLANRENGLLPDDFIPFGHHIAKISKRGLEKLQSQSDGKLILVTAISPTPAGEGKTTTTIGLADALNLALANTNQRAMVCIREPSLGPVFGLKGGATGGGFSQVVPMEDINLHFTGDFHAITSANNLLAALIDNHLYHGNPLNIDPNSITWHRSVDMNDRALRRVELDLINKQGEHESRQTGFDITVASEVMAIFCLAHSLEDLKTRLGNIQIGLNKLQKAVYARDLKAEGAMTALLKHAFQPNIVQTLGHTPVIVHGGPFANIAHGCNSVVATKAALKLADYVVTEAGFGADLGAEKFINIKCRQADLMPSAVVLVATVRALKYHGGVHVNALKDENLIALGLGLSNIEKHIENLSQHFGLKVVLAINHFESDTTAELNLLKKSLSQLGVEVVLCHHWAEGGKGALALANQVLSMVNDGQHELAAPHYLYENQHPIEAKITTIAQKLYGASKVEFSDEALAMLTQLKDSPAANYPVCIAKTQYSFSSDPTLRGAPKDHTLNVRAIRLANGAGFIVAICGNIMTMPGLPIHPASEHIDVNENGMIVGLS
jgi:formate--tetrahydrofolate ligase